MSINAPTPSHEAVSPPASSWVRFLRSYGPTPNNLNLFDEYISGALGRAKVKPITLTSPQLDKMCERILSGAPGSLLIAGTAGDGKTYHCRSLWTTLGGNPQQWSDPSLIKTLSLADGRTAAFVKDLSELDNTQGDEALEMLERSVLKGDDSLIVVVAANHGQILERLRVLGNRQSRVHPLRKPIQDVFLQSGSGHDRLAVFDLSRTAHRQSLEEVLNAVAGHPEWENCKHCALNTAGRVCPIFENRTRILGHGDEGRFTKRLGDLVEIAKLNGAHLPVRDLLALAANMILGHRDAKEGLMGCADIARLQENGAIERGNLYGNVFGANLPRRRALSRPVFRALAAFSIGEETSNAADGLLVYGADDTKLSESFARFVSADSVYGATTAFLSAQRHYLEGEEAARQDDSAASFIGRLEDQRRRLFFTLPEDATDYPFWRMTAFQFAGDYLELVLALADKRPVDDTIRARLVRGLNRVMTGLLIDNADRIFVASSGGFTQSRISVLCDTEAPARRTNGIGMAIRLDRHSGRPCLDVVLSPGQRGAVSFGLSPVRFEFLCRVAEGALPGSFSNECLEDMLAFKAKLLRQAELNRAGRDAHDGDEAEVGAESGVLSLSFIDIEQSGHGYTRPVTVRTGE